MIWKPLEGGSVNTVATNGQLVRRKLSDWSPAVHKLINYVVEYGLDYVPKIIDVDKKYEYFEYLDGIPALRPWSQVIQDDLWVKDLGKWLKKYHQIVKNFELSDGSFVWGIKSKDCGMIPCHGDLGPWNVLHINGEIKAIIDWDLARWGKPIDDLTQLALENIPLRKSTIDTMGDNVQRDVLMNRLECLCDSYGEYSTSQIIDNCLVHLVWMRYEVERLANLNVEPFVSFVEKGFLDIYEKDYKFIEHFWI